MTKPTKPTVPPAPSRSNPGVDFSNKADAFAAFQTTFADYMDATAEFVDDRADAALAAALGGSLPPLTGQTGRFLRVASPTSVTFSPDLIQDANGNLGLGVVPSAWLSTIRAIQLGTGGSISNWTGSSGNLGLGANFYYDGSGAARYINTAAAARFDVNTGSFSWFTAPSGTAGQPIPFTQAMTLDASGNLLIGKTSAAYSAAGRATLEINGSSTALLEVRAGTSSHYLYNDGTNLDFVVSNAGTQRFFTNGTERARIDANGDITVSNPAQLAGHLNSALTFGAIGSYAFLYIATASAISEGDVIAGSSLSPAGVSGGAAAAITADATQSAFVTRGAATMAGSWRSMGRIANAPGTLNARIGLFLRIS